MGNLVDFAKKELALVGGEEDGMQRAMNKGIIEILEKFSEQGHSGFSASYAIGVLRRLMNFLPLKPLTGETNEWTEYADGMFQNNRCSTVFKDGVDGKAYWIEGKIFSDDGGETWFTSRDSKVYIEFPFNVPTESERVLLPKAIESTE